MKAIRAHAFGGPDVLQLDDLPDPTPGPGQVRVRLHAAGVNPFDTYMLSGTYAIKPPLPYSPGADGAGVVEAVGDGRERRRRRRPRLHRRHRRPQGLRRLSPGRAVRREPGARRCPIGSASARARRCNVPCVTAFRALDRAAPQGRRHGAGARRERRRGPGRRAAGAGGRVDGDRLGRHRRRPRPGRRRGRPPRRRPPRSRTTSNAS